MKHTLIAIVSGRAGCVLSGVRVSAGIVKPPLPEVTRPTTAPPELPAENTAALDDLRTDNNRLRGELRSLRATLEGVAGDMAKVRDASRADAPPAPSTNGTPGDSTTPASTAGFSSEDVLWMRLFIRAIKPMLYGEAVQQMKSLSNKLYEQYKEKQNLSGITLDTLWPEKERRSRNEFWWREDFALLISGASNGEIELVGDPNTPRLKLYFDFSKRKELNWSREISGITGPDESGEVTKTNSEEARSSEARAACGAMKDRARVCYQRDPNMKIEMASLGLGKTELDGSYFSYDDYEVSGTAEEFVVRCKNVYSDEPYDLICTCNLKTGEARFNR